MKNEKTNSLKNELNNIFHEVENCKENKLSIDQKDIKFRFKPDKGIKDKQLQNELFPNMEDPKLCDCIIQKDNLIIIELKYETITESVFKTIEEKLLNVGKILQEKDINFHRAILIYHRLDSTKRQQLMAKTSILGKQVKCYKFKNKAFKL